MFMLRSIREREREAKRKRETGSMRGGGRREMGEREQLGGVWFISGFHTVAHNS